MRASELVSDEFLAIFDCVNESYVQPMRDLLPPGRAWDGARRPGSTFSRFLAGLALEFSRVEKRGSDLLIEYHPGEAVELLEAWEKVLGLPRCKGIGELTLAQRQKDAWNALIGMAQGGPTKAFFLQLGLDLGFDMTITLFDYSMFRCNSRCNAVIYGDKWAHVWQVNTTSLGEATDALLKCTFKFWSPLHTVIKWNIVDP